MLFMTHSMCGEVVFQMISTPKATILFLMAPFIRLLQTLADLVMTMKTAERVDQMCAPVGCQHPAAVTLQSLILTSFSASITMSRRSQV
jgi:hypothetical protein